MDLLSLERKFYELKRKKKDFLFYMSTHTTESRHVQTDTYFNGDLP